MYRKQHEFLQDLVQGMIESHQHLWKCNENKDHMQAGTFSSSPCWITLYLYPQKKFSMLSPCHRGYYLPFYKHFDSMHTSSCTDMLQIRERGKNTSNHLIFFFNYGMFKVIIYIYSN